MITSYSSLIRNNCFSFDLIQKGQTANKTTTIAAAAVAGQIRGKGSDINTINGNILIYGNKFSQYGRNYE